MTTIGIDMRYWGGSGIGTTLRQLLSHVNQADSEGVHIFHNPGQAIPFRGRMQVVPHPPYGLGQHWGLGRIINRTDISFLHIPHFIVPFGLSKPFTCTVHDLIPFLFPQYSTRPLTRFYSRVMLRRVAREARRIIAVSENTKNDLLRAFPEAQGKVQVIYPGIEPFFRPPSDEEYASKLAQYGLTPGYLLYVGNLRKGKNTEGLIRAYARLGERMSPCPPLVLAGQNYLRLDPGTLPEGIRLLGEVPPRDLPSLYRGACLFVFPTLYEGFGLPPLEALACGTAPLVSRRASLPEVCGDGAFYVDPDDPEAIARGIEAALGDAGARGEILEKGRENLKRFSVEKAGEESWALFQDVLRELGER